MVRRKKRVAIISENGFYRSVLAISRSLTRIGYEVHILTSNKKFGIIQNLLKTKYCSNFRFIPDLLKNQERSISYLLKYVKLYQIYTIIPVTDTTSSFLSFYKDKLNIKILTPKFSIFYKAINKWETLKLAKKLNISIPKTIEFKNTNEIRDKIRLKNFKFPLILKPKIRGDKLFGTKLIFKHKDLEYYGKCFNKVGKKLPFYNYNEPLIQEFIKGRIYDCCTLSYKGNVKSWLTQVRHRNTESFGGAGVVNITTETEEIINLSKKLLNFLNWTGPAQVEWIRDKNGNFKLMEINPRFWGTLQLSIDAGINFPSLALRLLEGKDPKFRLDYTIGLKKRWLIPEELISVIKDKKRIFKRLNEFFNFGEFLSSNVVSNIDIDDLRPFFFNLIFSPMIMFLN